MKTIKQIADELGVSKQSIQKRISREPLCTRIQQFVHTKAGTKYFCIQGETLIIQAFSEKGMDTAIDTSIDKTNDVYTHVYTMIETLKKELEVKNQQIEELSAQNTALTTALVTAQQTVAAAQALHGATVKQNIEDNEIKQREKGILARIFGKSKDL